MTVLWDFWGARGEQRTEVLPRTLKVSAFQASILTLPHSKFSNHYSQSPKLPDTSESPVQEDRKLQSIPPLGVLGVSPSAKSTSHSHCGSPERPTGTTYAQRGHQVHTPP